MPPPSAPPHATTIAYLGPPGTFTEQALLTVPDLSALEQLPLPTIPDVLLATDDGRVDIGFVAIENAIEGSVNVTLDMLAFETELFIQREVVMPVSLHLLAHEGVRLDDVTTVVSFPHASAQCRRFLAEHLPGVATRAANSTAEAARVLAEGADAHTAVIATSRAAELYDLRTVAAEIEDHPENATRFVAVARDHIPPPTGHDKTSLLVFQRADAPGSLLSILQEFAARSINLTKLESRPTKRGLGDYCFLIDLEGHLDDKVVADALRSLKHKQAGVKLLGSYPAAGDAGEQRRAESDVALAGAEAWLAELRQRIGR
ncbi:MAG: prephenate dehydratase [Acidimicrobiia bacterium]|nr:prephenate dehydratase [Acidimicrobiia bacterium]